MFEFINWEVVVLLGALILIDYVTGIIGAAVTSSLKSSKMRQGLLHKASYILVLVFAVVVTTLANNMELGVDLSGGIIAVICWIVLTESISIIENLVIINPKLEGNPFFAMFTNHKEPNHD